VCAKVCLQLQSTLANMAHGVMSLCMHVPALGPPQVLAAFAKHADICKQRACMSDMVITTRVSSP
jgi:hypothetical protein